jgi:phage antirepressor YoqD-like protein
LRAKRSIAIGGLAATLLGGGAALAARDDGNKTEDAILGDAAKRLGVTQAELEDALAKAEDAQIDKAVKDGKLTKKQADELKKRRDESGRVLGFPGGGPRFEHHRFGVPGPGFGGPGPLGDVAKALGIGERKLFSQLRDGKTLAQIAKAQGKTLDDVRAALKKAEEAKIAAAVKDGKLTQEQADEILEHLDERLQHLGEDGPFGGRRMGPPPGEPGGHGFGGPPPPRWD